MDEARFWWLAIARGRAMLLLRVKRGIVRGLETTCEFLDDLPRVERVGNSLWSIERGKYGCRWFRLVDRSKELDEKWNTECWSDT